MGWFQKNRRPEVWEVAGDRPLGDIEAAHKIREICAAASSSAENIAAFDNHTRAKKRLAETERYQAARKRALELAMRISDDSMRDVSVSQIMALCGKANDLKTARILLRAIQSKITQAELIAGNPALVNREAAN